MKIYTSIKITGNCNHNNIRLIGKAYDTSHSNYQNTVRHPQTNKQSVFLGLIANSNSWMISQGTPGAFF